jgi:hypothetical protein
MKRKCLAIGIILLFIGVAVAPSINQSVVTASQEDDLVEVTTQACGIQGYGDTTVKLTREQYQGLELYLVEFRARLNQTTTREEAIPLYKETVVELDKYGLLPKGMSVEKAQKLVLSSSNVKNGELFRKILWDNQKECFLVDNLFCLVCGLCSNSVCFSGTYSFLRTMLSLTTNLHSLYGIFFTLAFFDYMFLSLIRFLFPLHLFLFGEITFGRFEDYHGYGDNHHYPSTGWISSIGILGVKTWSDNFYGRIREIEIHGGVFEAAITHFYTGIIGFTGLSLSNSGYSNFMIGSCLCTSLSMT